MPQHLHLLGRWCRGPKAGNREAIDGSVDQPDRGMQEEAELAQNRKAPKTGSNSALQTALIQGKLEPNLQLPQCSGGNLLLHGMQGVTPEQARLVLTAQTAIREGREIPEESSLHLAQQHPS